MNQKKYDYLVVGAGLFGSVFAREMTDAGFRCLVVDKRNHIGGNAYTETVEWITVHRYGAHIFHTGNREVWEYVSRFARFNSFVNMPVAVYRGEVYNLPFNMNTFHQLWGVITPAEARQRIEADRGGYTGEPQNLEEQAIRLVGKTVYEKLVKEYTQKQWGKPPRELPAFLIRRLPVRFTYDNNYFRDPYQGIPEGGYTRLAEALLEGAEVRLNTDFLTERAALRETAEKVVYTGAVDAYFGNCFGPLQYRSLRFESETLNMENYQGCAVVNYTSADVPYTRIIEHKHFEFGMQEKTVITREYPLNGRDGAEPYYPINDAANSALYEKYAALARKEKDVIFGGRLGTYRYLDMDQVAGEALRCARAEIARQRGTA